MAPSSDDNPTLLQLREVLVEYILSRFDLPDPKVADVVVAWAFGSYCFELFDAFPRLVFYGPKQSGKSKMLTFLSKVCYNAKYSVIPTVATLYRMVKQEKPSIILDEFNLYRPSEKADLVAILRQGYKKGATVPRSEKVFIKTEELGQKAKKEMYVVSDYQVYCPIAFAGLTINDDQLLDRCIAINLFRSDNWDVISKNIDQNEIEVDSNKMCMGWEQLRGLIESAIINNAKAITNSYSMLHGLVSPMSGRDQEVWYSLLAIAHAACEGKHHPFWDNIHAYMRDYITRKKEEDLSSFDAQVLETIGQLDLSMSFTAKEIADLINKDLDIKEHVSTQAVGQALKRLGINYKLSQGRKRYFITEEEYKLKRQRFGMPEDE